MCIDLLLKILGMHSATREKYGALVRDRTIQGEDVWRLFRSDNGKGHRRTTIRHFTKLQPLLLPHLHQKMATGASIRKQNYQVGCYFLLINLENNPV